LALIDEFRKIIEDYLEHSEFTSASPGHTNVVKSIIYSYEPNENDIRAAADAPLEPEGRGTLPKFGPDVNIGQGKSIIGKISDPISAIDEFLPVAKLVPVVGAILGLPATLEILKRLMHAPGMPFDPRYKRDLPSESVASIDRELKSEIRQGIVLLRITSSKTQRGEVGIGQTGQVGLTGVPIYDQDLEAFQKGVVG
jgi:hypothetical protein